MKPKGPRIRAGVVVFTVWIYCVDIYFLGGMLVVSKSATLASIGLVRNPYKTYFGIYWWWLYIWQVCDADHFWDGYILSDPLNGCQNKSHNFGQFEYSIHLYNLCRSYNLYLFCSPGFGGQTCFRPWPVLMKSGFQGSVWIYPNYAPFFNIPLSPIIISSWANQKKAPTKQVH